MVLVLLKVSGESAREMDLEPENDNPDFLDNLNLTCIMENMNIIKASKKRRLQIFRDHIFDANNYDFFEEDGKCLQTQMAEAAGVPFTREDVYASFAPTAKFFGLSEETIEELRYAENWDLATFTGKTSAERAIHGLNNIIKNYDTFKS